MACTCPWFKDVRPYGELREATSRLQLELQQLLEQALKKPSDKFPDLAVDDVKVGLEVSLLKSSGQDKVFKTEHFDESLTSKAYVEFLPAAKHTCNLKRERNRLTFKLAIGMDMDDCSSGSASQPPREWPLKKIKRISVRLVLMKPIESQHSGSSRHTTGEFRSVTSPDARASTNSSDRSPVGYKVGRIMAGRFTGATASQSPALFLQKHDFGDADNKCWMGSIEEDVLAHFIRVVDAHSSKKSSDGLFDTVTSDNPMALLHPDSIHAAAGVMLQACIKAICHANDPSRCWGADLWKDESASASNKSSDKHRDTRGYEQSTNAYLKKSSYVGTRSKIKESSFRSDSGERSKGGQGVNNDLPHNYSWEECLDGESRHMLDSALWDGAAQAEDSRVVWEVVWSAIDLNAAGYCEKVKAELERLSDSMDEVRLHSVLAHRRKFRVPFNPKFLTGNVLLLACMIHGERSRKLPEGESKTQRLEEALEVVKMLIRYGADPNAMYTLFPAGKNQASAVSALCFAIRNVTMLQTLIDHKADLSIRTKVLNYHPDGDMLWQAAWSKDDAIVAFLLPKLASEYQPLVFGWHPDMPPLHPGSVAGRCTALSRAIQTGMKCVGGRCAGYWKEEQLEAIFKTSMKDMHPKSFQHILHGLADKLTFLLRMPGETILQTHPMLLENMWADLSNNRQAVEAMRKAIRSPKFVKSRYEDNDVMEMTDNVARDMVVTLISHAPQAARVILDEFFLQQPDVTAAHRNPLDIHGVIDKQNGMNTQTAKTCKWTYNSDTFDKPAWQPSLTRSSRTNSVLPANTWAERNLVDMLHKGIASWRKHFHQDQVGVSQFCQIRVVHLCGMLHVRIFKAIGSLSYGEQVRLLHECTTLRAVVFHTFETQSVYNTIMITENAFQLCSIIAMCVGIQDSGAHLLCWLMFSVPAVARAIYDTFLLFHYVVYALLRHKTAASLRGVRHSVLLSWMAHVCSLWLTSLDWHFKEGGLVDLDDHRYLVVIMLFSKALELLFRLSSTYEVGQLVIPIVDAFTDPVMISMLFILCFAWIVSFVAIHVVRNGANKLHMKETGIGAWVNLVVGEPVLMGEDENLNEWMLTSICHLIFAIVLLNMLLATTMDAYGKMSKNSQGRQIRKKAVYCQRFLVEQFYLNMAFHHLFDQKWYRLLFFVFVIGTVVVAFLMTGDYLTIALVWLLILTAALFVGRLMSVLLGAPNFTTKNDKDHEDQQFLWVCTPEAFEDSDDKECRSATAAHEESLKEIKSLAKQVKQLQDAQAQDGNKTTAGWSLERTIDPKSTEKPEETLQQIRSLHQQMSKLLEQVPLLS